MLNKAQLEVLHAGFVAGAACLPLLIRAEREHQQPIGVGTNPLTINESRRGLWNPPAIEWEILLNVL